MLKPYVAGSLARMAGEKMKPSDRFRAAFWAAITRCRACPDGDPAIPTRRRS